MADEPRVGALVAAFELAYGRAPAGIAEAPGRVNLIGEHVDYNEGLVLPLAIDRSVLCAWGRRENGRRIFRSMQHDGAFAVDAGTIPQGAGEWFDYPAGVVEQLAAAGFHLGPVDVLIDGDVPEGAGLSSSAALEVAVAGAMRDAFALAIDDVALARLCQRAENEYVGVQSGIMDQFASVLSKRGHALLIDCRTLAYEHVPLRLAEHGLSVVIANSAVSRELASSAYNERRRECESAIVELRERLRRPELRSLREVTLAEIEAVDVDTRPLRRARHVVTEIGRVAVAVEALRVDDFDTFGALMEASHRSLRDDYDVSSAQLDLLVGLASAQEYVAGARLTGAGFGGCTVNIVRRDAIGRFEADVVAAYRERTGLPAAIYVTAAHDGLGKRTV